MAAGQISAVGPIDFGQQYAPSPVTGGTKVPQPPMSEAGAQPARSAVAAEAASRGAPGARQASRGTAPFQPTAATRTPRLVSAAPGHLPQATPSNANVSMILFDLQSGIRRAQALLQSVASEVPSFSSRMMVAKAYSLEVQAQQELTRLQTEGIQPAHEWYA